MGTLILVACSYSKTLSPKPFLSQRVDLFSCFIPTEEGKKYAITGSYNQEFATDFCVGGMLIGIFSYTSGFS